MENEGLLFIPDISGYTKFINETEIEHSRFIIQELLEILVNSNTLNLSISEIEGDAILFYRFGKAPAIEEMYLQVETMFRNFHAQLKRYEQRRICPCSACKSAQSLSLKIISHRGEFSTYSVKDFSKLIGKDVIKVHQLLKNDIPLHEYWMVTDPLYKPEGREDTFPSWLEWKAGSKRDEADEINFSYSLLTPLKETLPEDDPQEFAIKGEKVKVLSVQRDLDANVDEVFNIITDLPNRAQWLEAVVDIKDVSTKLPQVGQAHTCILPKGTNSVVTSYYSRTDDSITFEETDLKKTNTMQIILEKIQDDKTRLTVTLYLRKNFMIETMFKLFMKKKYETVFTNAAAKLEKVARSKAVAVA
jgi:hypothetical protein